MNDIRLYTVKDMAALFKVTPRTIYGRIKRGEISPVKKGKYWYFTEDNIKEYLKG